MKPSSLSWLLSVKSTANQMNVASTSPSLAMSSSVMTPVASSAPRPRNAIAVESRPSVAAEAQSATMPTKTTSDDPFLTGERPERGKRLLGGRRRIGRAAHFGRDDR